MLETDDERSPGGPMSPNISALADSIPADMLRLTMRTLIADVMAVHRVSQITADAVVTIARQRAGSFYL